MSAEKLFNFRTFNGEVNKKALDKIRNVEKRLQCFPSFVGIAVRGSTTRGYSTEFSDLDLVLLYDSSVCSTGTDDAGHSFSFMLMVSEHGFSDSIGSVEMKKKDISPQRLAAEVPIIPADIFRVVTGTKIANYRKLYSEYLSTLTAEQRSMHLDSLARELMVDDSLGWKKMAERISGIPMSDYVGEPNLYWDVLKANGVSAPRNVYEEERLRLWQARIEKFLKQKLQQK